MGIFDESEIFTTYHARLRFRDKIMGGIPKDSEVIEGWIRSKAGVTDEAEITTMMLRTLYEMGLDVDQDASPEQLIEASKKIAGGKSAVGFKRDEGGLYIESRYPKACIKECVNILYSGTEGWSNPRGKRKSKQVTLEDGKKITVETDEGLYKKSPKNFAAERVFVSPLKIYLGVHEPTGVDLVIGHITGPQGPRATLTYHEYVVGATIEFDVKVTDDGIPKDAWPKIWLQAQEIGLGAVRSQAYGSFDIEEWEVVARGGVLKAVA